MANKPSIKPVMDYREVDEHIDAYKASTDMCAHNLREWQQQGLDITVLDLCWVTQDEIINEATSSYIDDMFFNEKSCILCKRAP